MYFLHNIVELFKLTKLHDYSTKVKYSVFSNVNMFTLNMNAIQFKFYKLLKKIKLFITAQKYLIE